MAWIKKYQLIIGVPFKLTSSVYKNGMFTSQYDMQDYVSKHANDNAFVLTDHHITFDYTADDTKHPNSANVTIYNMSDPLVDYIGANVEHNIAVSLYAGYEDEGMNLIFCSVLDAIEDRRDGVDRTTKLIFGDGSLNIQNAHISKTYTKGTKVVDVLKDISKSFGLPSGKTLLDSADTDTLSKNMHVMGRSSDAMDRIAVNYNYDWHIQNSKVNIVKQGKQSTIQVANISPETGLIGSPYIKTKYRKKKKKEGGGTDEKNNLVVTCKLHGAIAVGDTIYLKSRDFDGQFKVGKVTHSGSYHSADDWTTTLECAVTSSSARSATSKKNPTAITGKATGK